MPIQRDLPAFPKDLFSWSMFPTCPMVALQEIGTIRISVEGSRKIAWLPSLAIN
jgi:hypothetical protein